MKTVASMMMIGGLAAAAGVHAQDTMGTDDGSMGGTAYETMTTSSTQTVDGTTTNVQTQYISTTSVVPVNGVIGDAPATPALTADSSVKVKLQDGTIIDVPDSDDAPWNKDSRLSGYNRFTFDADTGAFVAGMGDEKFASNWDENGNKVVKKAPVVKKVKAKKVVVETAPAAEATEATPAEPEAAADAAMPTTTGETVTETVSQTVTETPTKKTTSTVTVTSTTTPAE